MTDLYLIAHKVRGEPAFDIASRMECPCCNGTLEVETTDRDIACIECDSLGYWWIIPTSGHRAYPWWWTNTLNLRMMDDDAVIGDDIEYCCGTMPADLPDHYPHREAPKQDLISLLGLIHKPLAPAAPIKRRF